MSKPQFNEPYEVIWLIRRLFRALGQKSNESLAERGISAADRAVMEFLYPDRALSVPEIATQYQVSRQHVQVTVNALLKQTLLTTKPNPRHKRSPLIMLTDHGRDLFADIFRQDQAAIAALFADVGREQLESTRLTLQHLLNKLS